MSFIKGGVAELAIARPDSAKDQWVYKHPDQTIPNHAQLTVDSDEVALFFKDGKFVGSFSAGRHTLDASNIPFLGQLIDKFTGGNVFICEVYFVTTRELPSIKFGTSIGDVQDPQTRLRIRLMVYGEFSARVIDPTKLVIGLVGQRATTNEGFLGWFKSQIQKVMKNDIAGLIVKQNWPLMKVTSGAYTEDIEQSTLQSVRKDIEPYGVEIMRFGDFSISMDQADKERLDKLVDRMAYVEGMGSASGGMAAYQQLAQAEMMMGAAEGMKQGGDGGGAAFQGAGVGLGFAMAGNMANMMGNANAQQPHAAAPAAPAESKDQIMAMLKQLGELKTAGILTDTEFDAKKKELLAKL
ncbi:MAG TPA: SPFH domain-containing protein [Kofleriaceae bacterium]|jgi:membrane protease subunit (stomatin/prohibitin family)|nr:SPFH domain-containing protein [Kofleriaceae bacterium]